MVGVLTAPQLSNADYNITLTSSVTMPEKSKTLKGGKSKKQIAKAKKGKKKEATDSSTRTINKYMAYRCMHLLLLDSMLLLTVV